MNPQSRSKSQGLSPGEKKWGPPEPLWERELKRKEGRLVQIVALAGNVRPAGRYVERVKKQNPAWAKAFDRVIRALVPTLYPERSEGKIYFDPKNPGNKAAESNADQHSLMFVDLGDAVILIGEKYGTEGMPAGFRRLYDHHVAQRISASPIEVAGPAAPLLPPPPASVDARPKKSQARAIETKSEERLLALFYAVVQGEWGWGSEGPVGRRVALEKIEKYIEKLSISRYGMNQDKIENLLDQAALKFPLRPERDSPEPSPQESS
ncbi:hypothetical protein FFI97_019310 [Variovorax sp. KBS0712]|uniref:hypothetical protein n=1 Tax=Variovorax sp. KBS0712 TaxID=2578111 RepID=UPI001117DFA2|nr:hypothetical protein [Variovorax sp. KBS0712]TSD56385.1 hypothetical protein FFI97_019310 [Variovorax sp. KBS0712]